MNRREFIFNLGAVVACLAFVLPSRTGAQQPKMLQTVGVMSFSAPLEDAAYTALRDSLHNLGYVEGQNIRIEFKNAHGDPGRLAGLAEELVQLRADVIPLSLLRFTEILTRFTDCTNEFSRNQ